MKNKPTALVLCGGIGTVSCALREVGFEVKGVIDHAAIPALSYAKNFPETPFWQASLLEINAKMICERFGIKRSTLSLVQVSSPCTGYSLTGTFEPTHVDNQLFFVAMFLALQLEPKVILFENVPSMTYDKMKVAFGMLGSFFNRLEEKYNIDGMILDSSKFGDGQSRNRLFIQCTLKVGVPMWPLPLPIAERKTISDILPGVKYLVSTNFGERTYEANETAPTITGHANIILGFEGFERKATAKELALLMSLPETFKLVGTEAEQILGIGNGVPVGLMSALLRTIKYDVLGYEKPEGLIHHSISSAFGNKTGYTIYKGPSRINGKEIIAVLTVNSSNKKTGDMSELRIIEVDADTSTLPKDTITVWKTYQNGDYPLVDAKDFRIFQDFPIMFSAYGDPYAIPEQILFELYTVASKVTSYTHQWERPDAASLKTFSMAVVNNLVDYNRALAAGWRTYRVKQSNEALQKNEMLCSYESSQVQCKDCNLCSGNQSATKNIAVHSQPVKKGKGKLLKKDKKPIATNDVVIPTAPTTDTVTPTVIPIEAEVPTSTTVDIVVPVENAGRLSPPALAETSNEDNSKIISIKSLMEQKFDELPFTDRWQTFLGRPSLNFNAIVHGMAGNGKSTLALQLAGYLSGFGKVIYVSGEEGFNKTFADKLKITCSKNTEFGVADLRSYEEILAHVKQGIYNFIFLDSLDTMKIGVAQMRHLRGLHNETAFITISQNTKAGLFRGSYELIHDSDICIRVEDGVAVTEKNRFKQKGLALKVF